MRKLRIAIGKTARSGKIANKAASWEKLVDKLTAFKITDETFAEYMRMSVDEQGRIKDVGCLIGGIFSGDTRRKSELRARSLITLDIDHISEDFEAEVDLTYCDLEYVMHSTHKHQASAPRLRLVFPLSRDVKPSEYEPLSRKLADRLGMDAFDDTTFQPARIMYWPSRSEDGEEVAIHNEGDWVDPDELLGEYADWQDWEDWPISSRVGHVPGTLATLDSPLDKPGIVGAFCRTYTVQQAIEEFIPDKYTPLDDSDTRYSWAEGSGQGGAVVYDDEFLYSHHESDPTSPHSVNAFDLVRIHQYGDLDDTGEDDKSVPATRRESYKTMAAMAAAIPEVSAELVDDEFSDRAATPMPADPQDDDPDTEEEGSSSDAEVDEQLAEDARRITVQNVRDDIDAAASEEQVDAVLTKIAAASFSDVEIGRLAGAIREQSIALFGRATAPSKEDIKNTIKDKARALAGKNKEAAKDMQVEMLDYILRRKFKGGKTLKYIDRTYWSFAEGLWAIDADARVEGAVSNTITELRVRRPDDQLELLACVGDDETNVITDKMVKLLRRRLAVREDRDDPLQLLKRYPLPVINCRNCELHFDEAGAFEVRDHDPSHFFTVRIDTPYDPDAESPLWDEFTQLVFSDYPDHREEMIRHLEELGGYTIQMSRWLKTWVMLYGPTNTGKSTFQDVVTSLLGGAALAKGLEGFGGNFSFRSLVGKLLVTEDDMPRGAYLDDGLIKKISEEKLVGTEVKWADDINFMSRAYFMINSNHWPRTKDLSPAFCNRALIFPFTYDLVKHGHANDGRRQKMIMEERPGILNRFIAGLQRLRERGTFDPPEPCLVARDRWLARANPASAFLHDCTERHKGHTKTSALWESYVLWFGSNYPGGRITPKDEFFERIDMLLGARVKYQGHYCYKGVVIKGDAFQSAIEDEFEADEDFLQ